MILEAIKIATNNFTTGFYSSTLMGWFPEYDKQGRPLNCDPNYKSGTIRIEGKQYWFVRHGFEVRLWDKQADYLTFNQGDHIEEMDITPDYVKEYYESKLDKHSCLCKICGEGFDSMDEYYSHYDEKHNKGTL